MTADNAIRNALIADADLVALWGATPEVYVGDVPQGRVEPHRPVVLLQLVPGLSNPYIEVSAPVVRVTCYGKDGRQAKELDQRVRRVCRTMATTDIPWVVPNGTGGTNKEPGTGCPVFISSYIAGQRGQGA